MLHFFFNTRLYRRRFLLRLLVSRAEHAALKANHSRCLALVPCEHPCLDICALIIRQTLLYVLLEQILHACGA